MAVTLLPEPDSPTSATVLFSGTSKLTPLTASWRCMTPSTRPMRKATLRSWMLNNINALVSWGQSYSLRSGGLTRNYSRPRSLGSRASRNASVNSANAVTNTAMQAVTAASCHQ